MSIRSMLVIAFCVTGLTAIPVLRAQEKTIKRAELPPAVEKTIVEQSKGATIRGFSTEVENGQKLYEVELGLNGRGKDVSMDERGNVLEVEEEIPMNSLPPAVKEGLTRAAGKGTINKVESLTKKGKLVAYEAAVTTGTKTSEIQVGPDGGKLAHPE
jgi:hypothetical protein